MSRSLVLIGMMGVGKTTVGQLVAERLQREHIDTDHEIERRTGRTVVAIIADDGEPSFRALERAVVSDVTDRTDRVLSVGGGAVLDPRNTQALRSSGWLVLLDASTERLVERLTAAGIDPADERPLLAGDDLRARLETLIEDRRDIYRDVADAVVDASGGPERITELLLAFADAAGVLTDAERERVTSS